MFCKVIDVLELLENFSQRRVDARLTECISIDKPILHPINRHTVLFCLSDGRYEECFIQLAKYAERKYSRRLLNRLLFGNII